jgi:hypothetical protein
VTVGPAVLFLVQTLGPPATGARQTHDCPLVSAPQLEGVELHAVHVPLMHKAPAQSLRLTQVFPSAQRGQAPPQSTSVSLPFLIPSLQVGAVDRFPFLLFFLLPLPFLAAMSM